VPDWAKSPGVLPYYFLLAIVLYETTVTVICTNYGALFPEMFRNLAQRAQAAPLKRGTELFGLILGIALAPVIYAQFGFAGMALLFAGLALFAFLFFLSGVEEDLRAESGLGLLPSFRLVFANRAFWVAALVGLLFDWTYAASTCTGNRGLKSRLSLPAMSLRRHW
jgi:GPH family glycoside/pentoside/hexuronide:cation symporter